MNQNKNFLEFDKEIKLQTKKEEELIKKREILRTAIRENFTKNERKKPLFRMQGSFPLRTTLNSIKRPDGKNDEIDLDDGVYIQMDSYDESTWISPSKAHSWVKEAVEKGRTVVSKNPCVRVVYANDYHIDLPVYIIFKDSQGKQQVRYGRKDKDQWINRDPKKFRTWFLDEISNNEQLRRLVRYLKAWKDYRVIENKESKGLGGFQLTVIAENYQYKSICDEECFYMTVKSINEALSNGYIPPLDNKSDDDYPKENVLENYSDARIEIFKDNFKKLYNKSYKAYIETDQEKSSLLWKNVFGKRFPKDDNETDSNPTKDLGTPLVLEDSETRDGSGSYA